MKIFAAREAHGLLQYWRQLASGAHACWKYVNDQHTMKFHGKSRQTTTDSKYIYYILNML